MLPECCKVNIPMANDFRNLLDEQLVQIIIQIRMKLWMRDLTIRFGVNVDKPYHSHTTPTNSVAIISQLHIVEEYWRSSIDR